MARKWTEEQLRDLVSGDMEGFETVTESSGSWRHGHMLTVITKDLATGELWRVKATVHHSEGIQEVIDPVPVEAVTVTETRYLTAAEREKAGK